MRLLLAYSVTVFSVLLLGLLALSTSLQPADGIPTIRSEMPAKKIVPTTTAEMAAKAHADSAAVKLEFERRNRVELTSVTSSEPTPVISAIAHQTIQRKHKGRNRVRNISKITAHRLHNAAPVPFASNGSSSLY